MKIYDSHMHTKNSHDSRETVEKMAATAQALNFAGITITDHADVAWFKSADKINNILDLKNDILKCKDNFDIEILCGVELGDMLNSPYTKEIYKVCESLDFVLASTHIRMTYQMLFDDYKKHMPVIVNRTDSEVNTFLKKYYSNLKAIISTIKADSVAHITFPFKYISSENNIDVHDYYNEIKEVMDIAVKRDMALELNTSASNRGMREFMPNKDLLCEYKKLGGTKITLGSDAHVASSIGRNFDNAFALIKECGFNSYFIYKNRKPVEIPIHQ